MIGYALCGSFCTLERSIQQMEGLKKEGYDIQPLMSERTYTTDTRFGTAQEFRTRVEELTQRPIIHTVVDAEPLGPATPLEALIIAPCTGNTLAKIAAGITDTAIPMAAKAHLRADRPLIIALSSNDAMSQNLKNLSTLLLRKQVYLVPMRQDDPRKKPYSLIASFEMLPQVLEAAMQDKQLRPLFLES